MKLFDSSTGFRLPYNFVLSPYLVVELANPSDGGPRGLTALRDEDGRLSTQRCPLGWLLIPAERVMQPRPCALGSIASVAADAAPQPAAPAQGRCNAHHWEGAGHGGRRRQFDLFHGESVNLEHAFLVWIG